MGLAGRKQKQRIPADPRNLSWADDASRFGLSYLSKFGWDTSKGLGSSGDGMKTHLKVQQKLDMMGIGAQHQRDPNSIAWKQNKDFEALLKRLNESAEDGANGEDAEGCAMVGETTSSNAFVRAQEEEANRKLEKESSKDEKKRKREGDPDASKPTKKKAKKKEKKEDGRAESSPDDLAVSTIDPTPSALSSSEPSSESMSKPRPIAHRARIRAAKRITGKSASAIAEILGIASSSTSTSTSTPTPARTPTLSSSPAPIPPPSLSLDNLTTSTKSVADYFKEKLLARSSSSSSTASASTPSGFATPGLGAVGPEPGSSLPDDKDELPRRGIGSRTPALPPPPQTPQAVDGDLDGQDPLTDKQLRKAERKAERRRRREAEASGATALKEQVEEDDAEKAQRASKEEKRKKCQERKERTLADQSNEDDVIAEKGHGHDTNSRPLVASKKKSKKER